MYKKIYNVCIINKFYVMAILSKSKNKTFVNSEIEMYWELEKVNNKVKTGNTKFLSVEDLYKKNSNYIDNLSL